MWVCVCLTVQHRIRTWVTSSLHEIYSMHCHREWESHSCVDLFAHNSLFCQKQRVGTCFQHVGMRLWADEGGRISDHSPTSLGVRRYHTDDLRSLDAGHSHTPARIHTYTHMHLHIHTLIQAPDTVAVEKRYMVCRCIFINIISLSISHTIFLVPPVVCGDPPPNRPLSLPLSLSLSLSLSRARSVSRIGFGKL